MRILKNKTATECSVVCGHKAVVVPASDQADLAETFTTVELSTSDSLIDLLGQGVDKYQLNDGVSDLSASSAIDLVRYYQQRFPVTSDGKPLMLPSVFPYELLLNFAGRPDSGGVRYGGSLFGLEKAGVGSASVDFSFQDGIFVMGGHVIWRGGGYGSYVSLTLSAPATTVVDPETPNRGNCNLVATGLGFNLIVPASGDGAKDLGSVVTPVTAESDEDLTATGYWDYSDPWLGKGAVSAGTPQHAKFNLFDANLPIGRFCDFHLLTDTGSREAVLHSIKPKWFLPQWVCTVTINNAHADRTLQVGWDLVTARRSSV